MREQTLFRYMGKVPPRGKNPASARSITGMCGPADETRFRLKNSSMLIREQALFGTYGEKCFRPENYGDGDTYSR